MMPARSSTTTDGTPAPNRSRSGSQSMRTSGRPAWPMPSRATINRVLARRGTDRAGPAAPTAAARTGSRPTSPNTMWQMDGFDYTLADGAGGGSCSSRRLLPLRPGPAGGAQRERQRRVGRGGVGQQSLRAPGPVPERQRQRVLRGTPWLGQRAGGEPAGTGSRADHQLGGPPPDLRKERTRPRHGLEVAGQTPTAADLDQLQSLLDTTASTTTTAAARPTSAA